MSLVLVPSHASFEDRRPRPAPPGSGELVAVLEEHLPTARRIDELLRSLGYRVLAFTSPGAGLPLVSSHAVDLVLAQHAMRPRHAARLASIARSSRGVRRPGFVLVTDAPDTISEQDRQTYDAIVHRPVCRVDLRAALRRASARRSTPVSPFFVN